MLISDVNCKLRQKKMTWNFQEMNIGYINEERVNRVQNSHYYIFLIATHLLLNITHCHPAAASGRQPHTK